MDNNDFWQGKYPNNIARQIDTQAYATIIELFKDACVKYANKPAFSNLGHTLTFADVDKYSASFAAWLQRNTDLKVGDRIAIQLPNMLQYPIAVFGALRAGLVVVNTNPLYSLRELENQFKDSDCKAVVTLESLARNIQEVLPQTNIRHLIISQAGDLLPLTKRLFINHIVKYLKHKIPRYQLPDAVRFADILKTPPHKFKEVSLTANHIAVLQYTGGTTGIAKGAVLTHSSITSNMLQTFAFLSTSLQVGRETMVCPLPLYHVFAFGLSCMGMMLGIHTVLITDPRQTNDLINELKKYRFTSIMGINSLFVSLLNHPDIKTVDFSSLKLTIAGGSLIQPHIAEQWQQVTGCKICEGYGMTEASPVIAINPPLAIQTGTIGLPVPNTFIRIVGEDNQDCPLGECGELWVKGPQVMKGYWRHAQATADTITFDGWLKTGDIALIQADGYLRIVDRKKDIITIGGFNVYPNEIEAVVGQHPAIIECAAVGMIDTEGNEAIKLFVVRKDQQLTEPQLYQYLLRQLATYKLPQQIVFVESLPKSSIGKVLRRELKV